MIHCMWYSRLSHDGRFYKTDTSVKLTPRVGPCLSLHPLLSTVPKGGLRRQLTVLLVCTPWPGTDHDVRAAVLVVKNKSISLLRKLNSIFKLNPREKILLFWPPKLPPCHVVVNQEFASFGIPGSPRTDLQKESNFSCWTNWMRFYRCDVICTRCASTLSSI